MCWETLTTQAPRADSVTRKIRDQLVTMHEAMTARPTVAVLCLVDDGPHSTLENRSEHGTQVQSIAVSESQLLGPFLGFVGQ